jgi:hypothetical protein
MVQSEVGQLMALRQFKCACLLSQFHLSLFTNSAQRTKIHWCLVRQNRDGRGSSPFPLLLRLSPFALPCIRKRKPFTERSLLQVNRRQQGARSSFLGRSGQREKCGRPGRPWLPTSRGSKQPVAGSLLLSASTRTSCGEEPKIAQECGRDSRSTPEQAHFSASSRDGERPPL